MVSEVASDLVSEGNGSLESEVQQEKEGKAIIGLVVQHGR